MSKALIVYTSLTGNTMACSDIVTEELESLGVEVTVQDVFDSYAEDFEDYDICLVGSYTYGSVEGELPDEMEEFHEDLQEIDLTGKVYGVFGSGDTFYDDFCTAVDDFEEAFEKTGATKGGTGVKVNLYPEDEDADNLRQLAQSIVEKTN